jgi:hypothetical protein
MSRTSAFLLGALGGLLPILVSLLAIDLAPIIDHLIDHSGGGLTTGNYIGYAIRVVVLLFLGGIVALLNSEVKQPLAIVQLGIAAPALVSSFINGATAKPNEVQRASFSIVSVAHAQEAPARLQVAGGLFSDVTAGFGMRLDGVAAANAERKAEAFRQTVPPAAIDSVPEGAGSYCMTAAGKVPGSTAPIGSPCKVQTQSGALSGFVAQ